MFTIEISTILKQNLAPKSCVNSKSCPKKYHLLKVRLIETTFVGIRPGYDFWLRRALLSKTPTYCFASKASRAAFCCYRAVFLLHFAVLMPCSAVFLLFLLCSAVLMLFSCCFCCCHAVHPVFCCFLPHASPFVNLHKYVPVD